MGGESGSMRHTEINQESILKMPKMHLNAAKKGGRHSSSSGGEELSIWSMAHKGQEVIKPDLKLKEFILKQTLTFQQEQVAGTSTDPPPGQRSACSWSYSSPRAGWSSQWSDTCVCTTQSDAAIQLHGIMVYILYKSPESHGSNNSSIVTKMWCFIGTFFKF